MAKLRKPKRKSTDAEYKNGKSSGMIRMPNKKWKYADGKTGYQLDDGRTVTIRQLAPNEPSPYMTTGDVTDAMALRSSYPLDEVVVSAPRWKQARDVFDKAVAQGMNLYAAAKWADSESQAIVERKMQRAAERSGLIRDANGNVIGEKPLEQVSPEFDALLMGGAVKDIAKGIVSKANSKLIKPRKLPRITNQALENNLILHLQGNDAVAMFKEYGGTKIPEGSINGKLLRAYVQEARERYGIVGNDNITDEEIAQALYKHSKELAGNTAAINPDGEPLLLFRGSTKRNMLMHEKDWQNAKSDAGADNILGNLFLGEMPSTVPEGDLGVGRYVGYYADTPTASYVQAPETMSAAFKPVWADDVKIYGREGGYSAVGDEQLIAKRTGKYGDFIYRKIPAEDMEFGANDINAYIVRTPAVRDATDEISVLKGLDVIPQDKRLGQTLLEHYRNLVKLSEQNRQGLLHSKPIIQEYPAEEGFFGRPAYSGGRYRDEHEHYNYFAVPNWNVRNIKHLLPFDLRIPRNWADPNVYRAIAPIGGAAALTQSVYEQ